MSKHARRPTGKKKVPGLRECLFHRCDAHENVPQLNLEEPTGAECGACVAELMLTYKAQLMLVLDGYAERLTYSHTLKRQLTQARERLNIMAPGAGNFIDDFNDEEP
jgi:hypothetical protein